VAAARHDRRLVPLARGGRGAAGEMTND
jgi:hypothetical protein